MSGTCSIAHATPAALCLWQARTPPTARRRATQNPRTRGGGSLVASPAVYGPRRLGRTPSITLGDACLDPCVDLFGDPPDGIRTEPDPAWEAAAVFKPSDMHWRG